MMSVKRILTLSAFFLIFSSFLFLFSNCQSDNDKPNVPDVSGITANVTVHRFDQDIFAIDTNNTEGGVLALEQKYPAFTKLYFERIIGIKDPKDSVGKYHNQVRPFLSDVSMRGMMDTISLVYKTFDDIEKQIEEGLRFYKHYFPKKQVPTEIYTMPSAYNFAAVLPSDTTIAIGLDMFLGENHRTYESLITTYPKFISRTFRKDYLVNRVFELLVSDLVGEPKGNRLLDYMIHNGKKLYIIDCLLPNVPDSIKLAYTKEQMSGTYANEGFTWGRILKQNLLYSTKFQDFQKLVTPSPDAPVIAAEAPGGVGNFLGWQIVKQYMKRNPQTSLTDLINMQDAQKILDLSKYKPPK
ncbi:MAG: hypothetical protein JNL70_12460 [Saprospiraceae bacterium]|nr:hypothetical protein [Saprospiraceae bacterium]